MVTVILVVSVWFSDWVVADRYVVDSRVRFVAWLGGGSLFLSRFGVACFCFFGLVWLFGVFCGGLRLWVPA